jgi:hypothetical protein
MAVLVDEDLELGADGLVEDILGGRRGLRRHGWSMAEPGPGRCAGATSRSLGGGYAGAGAC